MNNFIALFLTLTFLSCNHKIKNTLVTFKKEFHDFEKIPYRGVANIEFNFTNVGENILQIQNIETTCGCTGVKWSKNEIVPNDVGVIEISYDTRYPGTFDQTITVFYNGKKSPQKIRIKGEVLYPK